MTETSNALYSEAFLCKTCEEILLICSLHPLEIYQNRSIRFPRSSVNLKMSSITVILLLLSFGIVLQANGQQKSLIVISVDGFRPDFLKYTKHLAGLKKIGIYGNVRPVYPTKTHTAHYTVATGLYPDKHGVVANKFFDHNLKMRLEHNWKTYKYRRGVTPIWTLNQLHGRKSTCM